MRPARTAVWGICTSVRSLNKTSLDPIDAFGGMAIHGERSDLLDSLPRTRSEPKERLPLMRLGYGTGHWYILGASALLQKRITA